MHITAHLEQLKFFNNTGMGGWREAASLFPTEVELLSSFPSPAGRRSAEAAYCACAVGGTGGGEHDRKLYEEK